MNESRAEYIKQFNKENYQTYLFRVKKSDVELVGKLDSVPNRNLYLTRLVMEDIHPSILTIKEIKARVKPVMVKHGIQNVYLFGSYARGEANRDSDVDIYCDNGDVDTLWKQSAFRDELAEALGKDADVVFIGSQMNGFFQEQLKEDGIKIF